MKHDLKVWPPFYEAIYRGEKRCELRRDDRGFRVGDELHLREYDPSRNALTGQAMVVEVTHIIRDVPEFGLEPGFCILSIRGPIR